MTSPLDAISIICEADDSTFNLCMSYLVKAQEVRVKEAQAEELRQKFRDHMLDAVDTFANDSVWSLPTDQDLPELFKAVNAMADILVHRTKQTVKETV